MRIAIAGLGAAARTIHIPAYREIAGVEMVGGCDPAAMPSDFAFPLFGSVAEMLERAKPDWLAVVTPPRTHGEFSRLGLQAGCHVITEKPMVESLEQADELIALSASAGRHVIVNNQYRFMKIHRAAHEQIGKPEFGALQFVSIEQTFFMTSQTEAGWRGDDQQRTVKEFGTHVLDLCRFFFGEDPSTISARMPRGGDPESPDYLVLMTLEFSGDRVAHIVLDRLNRGRHRYLQIRLDGTAATVETSIGGQLELSAGFNPRLSRPFIRWDAALGGSAKLYRGERSRLLAREPRNPFAAATADLMRSVLGALERGEQPPCSARDNRATLALALAAYEFRADRRTGQSLNRAADRRRTRRAGCSGKHGRTLRSALSPSTDGMTADFYHFDMEFLAAPRLASSTR